MAINLKVLEKGTDVNFTNEVVLSNIFELEATGYAGTSCTGTLSNHVWTITGNAATTSLYWYKNTNTAYALNKKIFVRARMTVTTSGASMTSMGLVVAGTTSGTQNVALITNPEVGIEYIVSGVVTLNGLVGNVSLRFYLADDVTTNTITMKVKEWLAIDLTSDQGAGAESSSSDMEAWVEWRMSDWVWLDWYARTDNSIYYKTDPYYAFSYLPGHLFSTGDTVKSGSNFWTVIEIDSNWIACALSSEGASGASGVCTPYYQTDRNAKLIAGTLKLNLRSDTEASASCDFICDASWQASLGMTVMIYNDATLLHAGKITSAQRSRYDAQSKWKSSVRIGTFTEIVSRAHTILAWPGWGWETYTSGAFIKAMIGYLNTFGLCVNYGRVEDGLSAIGKFSDPYNLSVANAVSAVAKTTGFVWYVDKYRKLHFRSPFYTAITAAHALVDGNGYMKFKDISYQQSVDQYRTVQLLTGGYTSTGARLWTYRTLANNSITPPITVDAEACTNAYGAFANDDAQVLQANIDAACDANLKIYGAQVPCTLSFSSWDIDWAPNTQLRVGLEDTGIGTNPTTVTQKLQNGNFSATTGWSVYWGALTVAGNVGSLTGDGTGSGVMIRQSLAASAIAGNKYYVKGLARVTNSSCTSLVVYVETPNQGASQYILNQANPVMNQWYPFSGVVTLPSDSYGVCYLSTLHFYVNAATANGKVAQYQYIDAFDLTATFGTAGEPTQAKVDTAIWAYDPTNGYVSTTAALDLETPIYMNIDSVEIDDQDGVNFISRISASQRDPANYASIPNSGSSQFLSDFKTAVQASSGSLKQDAGTFAPTMMGTGTPGTWAYTYQVGYYVRIGNLVWFNIRLQPSSITGSPTGNLLILGLPFLPLSHQMVSCAANGVAWGTSMTQLSAYVYPSGGVAYINLWATYNNGTWIGVPVANVTAADEIWFSGCYQIST